MKPELNNQPRRGTWPNPADTPLDRARRIAQMYRAHLNQHAPAMAAAVDNTCASYGETWMLEQSDIVDPDAALTTAQAAELVHVTPQRIRVWATTTHPEKPGQMLLPRFGMQGREQTYIAIHVLAAAACMRRRTSGTS
ncbi:MAG TPA: hypothetical protein VI172_12535 [Candidatus Dormibacteraeota bacterium]|jgi:hypothetical protein